MIFEVDNLLHSVMGHQKELSIDGGFVPEKISILSLGQSLHLTADRHGEHTPIYLSLVFSAML